jgi:hypothetical protein
LYYSAVPAFMKYARFISCMCHALAVRGEALAGTAL